MPIKSQADARSNSKQPKRNLRLALQTLYLGLKPLNDCSSNHDSRYCKALMRIINEIAERYDIGLSRMAKRADGRLPTCRQMLTAVDNISRTLEFLPVHPTIKMINEGELIRLRDEFLRLIESLHVISAKYIIEPGKKGIKAPQRLAVGVNTSNNARMDSTLNSLLKNHHHHDDR